MMQSQPIEQVNREERLDEAVASYLQAAEAGQAPDRRAWLARYPELAKELERFLAGQDKVEQLARPLRDAAQPEAQPSPTKVRSADTDGMVPGVKLGDFEIIREVGRGGMGLVYEVVQLSLGRRVALKVLPFAATMDPRHLQRFQNEARAAAALHHEHIVPVFAVGSERGVYYYAMQFVDGRTLAQVVEGLRREPQGTAEATAAFEPETEAGVTPAPETASVRAAATEPSSRGHEFFRRVAEWGSQAAEALEHAHTLGILHRDVKPGNLMVDARDKLWVTDFGLARTVADSGLTMTGDLLGTLRYMSPEQALARHGLVDHRTDVYSLGATLYELSTLRPAFPGDDRQELLRRIAFEDPVPLRRVDWAIPADLETIVLKAMAKEPQERYGTAQELADDLRRFLDHRTILAKRPSLIEKARKWGWRHRRLVGAAICLLMVAVLVLSSALVVISAERDKTADALHDREIAIEEKDHALQQARTHLKEANEQRQRANDHLQKALTLVHPLMQLTKAVQKDEDHARDVDTYRKLLSILQTAVKDFPSEIKYHEGLVNTALHLGGILMRVNQNVEAANSYRVAVDATERIGFPSLPYNPARDHFKVGTLLRRAEAGIVLGNTECDLGRLKQANQTFHTTLAVLDGHMKPLSEATNGTVVFPETYWWYRIRVEVGQGNVAAASGDARKAEEFYRQALAEAGKHQDHPLIEEARIEVLNGLARVLESQGRTAEAEHAYGEVRRALKSVAEKDPGWSWRLAWFLVTCPDAKFRDPPQAVELARQTTERAERNKSKHSNAYLTLGAALYRMGDGKAALAELAHARPGPHKAFFMAMVYHQLGDKKQARYAYDVGVRVMDANAPYDDELRRFRGEAAQLLGIESSKDRK